MKKITNNKFSIIGTNPNFYFTNYINVFNEYEMGQSFKIDFDNNSILVGKINILYLKSPTTLRQNIDCWVGLGLFLKKGNILIKILPPTIKENLFEFIKTNLIQHHPIEKINDYRDTILIKILQMKNQDFVEKNEIISSLRHTKITIDKINKEIGEFEKYLFKDKEFIEIVERIWKLN